MVVAALNLAIVGRAGGLRWLWWLWSTHRAEPLVDHLGEEGPRDVLPPQVAALQLGLPPPPARRAMAASARRGNASSRRETEECGHAGGEWGRSLASTLEM